MSDIVTDKYITNLTLYLLKCGKIQIMAVVSVTNNNRHQQTSPSKTLTSHSASPIKVEFLKMELYWRNSSILNLRQKGWHNIPQHWTRTKLNFSGLSRGFAIYRQQETGTQFVIRRPSTSVHIRWWDSHQRNHFETHSLAGLLSRLFHNTIVKWLFFLN